MQNKNLYESYEAARRAYDFTVVPRYGTTKMDWGFGRWLWLEYKGDTLDYWRSLNSAGILTQDGVRRLRNAEKNAREGK